MGDDGLKLFLISTSDGDTGYVEAIDFGEAAAIWREATELEDEPELVHMVSDGPVLRRPIAPDRTEATERDH